MNAIIQPNPDLNQPIVSSGGAQNRYEVSRQWYSRPSDERFTSLPELHAFTSKLRHASEANVIENKVVDFIAPEQPQSIADTQVLYAGLPDGVEADFTNWSFSQACGLTKCPTGFMRQLSSQLAADCLHERMRSGRTNAELVKSYHLNREDGGTELRALTGPDYGRIHDNDVIAAVMEVAGDGLDGSTWHVPAAHGEGVHYGVSGGPVHVTKDSTTLFASDRDMFIFLIDTAHPIVIGNLPDGRDDIVYRGFYIMNSEVGGRACRIACMYLRDVCANRILWGVEGFQEISIRHSKFAPDRFIGEATPALRDFANGSVNLLIEGVEKAKAAKVAHDDEEALDFLRKRGTSRRRAAAILDRVEQEEQHPARSAWDMAQGITALARDEKHNDTRLNLEGEAKKILEMV